MKAKNYYENAKKKNTAVNLDKRRWWNYFHRWNIMKKKETEEKHVTQLRQNMINNYDYSLPLCEVLNFFDNSHDTNMFYLEINHSNKTIKEIYLILQF